MANLLLHTFNAQNSPLMLILNTLPQNPRPITFVYFKIYFLVEKFRSIILLIEPNRIADYYCIMFNYFPLIANKAFNVVEKRQRYSI